MNITEQLKEAEVIETVKEQTVEANTAPKFLTETFLKPERLEDETQEHYKMRQKANKLYLKFKKKGQLLWLSKDVAQAIKGTSFNKEKFIKAMREFEEAQVKQESLKEVAKTTTETSNTSNI